MEYRTFWDFCTGDTASMAVNLERSRFWMGPGTGHWLRGWPVDGWVARAEVHRIPAYGHAVAVLDASDQGVLLMDPLHGHVIKEWAWFLGPGPGCQGAHYIAGWYRLTPSPASSPQEG